MNQMNPQELKEQSMKVLADHNISVMEGLPLLESYDELKVRTKEEVVQRLLALMTIAIYAEGLLSEDADVKTNRNFITKVLSNYNGLDYLSDNERSFYNNDDPTQQEIIHHTWQYEPFATLMWALGFVETDEALDIPATICDVSKNVRIIRDLKNEEGVLEAAKLRDKSLIMEQTDIIYRYDWACVDDRINGRTIHQDAWGIVMERHKALNWLTHYMDEDNWDYVGTDT